MPALSSGLSIVVSKRGTKLEAEASVDRRAQLDTTTDSLSPPERGEGWGEGI
ncbi:MAG: hypothetical protein ABSH11_07635 [Verrucomicrobiota bacterium]